MNGDVVIQQEHRSWAIEVLGFPEEQPVEKHAELALQRISDDDFVLWNQADLAVRILASSERSVWSQSDVAALNSISENALASEVEEFCQNFFQFAPKARKKQFELLAEKCRQYPALRLRLEELSPGLNLLAWSKIRKQEENSELSHSLFEFGKHVVEIFLAHPGERGEIERSLKKRWGSQLVWKRHAARDFAEQFPDYAKLASGFVDRIQQLKTESSRWRTRATTSHSTPQEYQETQEVDGWTLLGIIFVGLIVVIIRIALSSAGSSPSSTTYNPHFDSSSLRQKPYQVSPELEDALRRTIYGDEYRFPFDSKSFNNSGSYQRVFIPFTMDTENGERITIFTLAEFDRLLMDRPELKREISERLGYNENKRPELKAEAPEPVVFVQNKNLEMLDELPDVVSFVEDETPMRLP